MKRFIKLVSVVMVLCAVLAVSAFAADFTHCADSLSELGLFKGTANGYELDRAPTRAEAATMLVRLLGAEDEAMELAYTAPFSDVQDWAKPYVQYLYANGLTKGTSETTFGYSEKCTAAQYATFLLRALGYSDAEGGDFVYTEAMAFAREKGVVDLINCNENSFLRDHVAAMSYTALALPTADGEQDLLTSLVGSGAVKDAKGCDKLFENYRAYIESSKAYSDATGLSMDMYMTAGYKLDGAEYMTTEQKFSIICNVDTDNMDDSKMSCSGEITTAMADSGMNVTIPLTYYYTDGYMYASVQGQKVKTPMSYEDALSEINGMSAKESTDPICMIKSIDVQAANGGVTTYTVSCHPEALNLLLGMALGDDSSDTEYKSMTTRVVIKGNAPIAVSGDMELVRTAEGRATDITVSYSGYNLRTGSGITVKLPDNLDTYTEAE